jgi:hypothetical protein
MAYESGTRAARSRSRPRETIYRLLRALCGKYAREVASEERASGTPISAGKRV